ncbi:MAG: ABC transporter ATP-binding protein [Planctomycetota bacterium]
MNDQADNTKPNDGTTDAAGGSVEAKTTPNPLQAFMRNFRMLYHELRGQRLRYLAAMLALVAASLTLYAGPLVIQATLDGVVLAKASSGNTDLTSEPRDLSAVSRWTIEILGGAERLRDDIWIAAVVAVALTVLAGVFTYFRGRWAAQASEAIAKRIRDEAYDHLQRLPMRFYRDAKTGDLIQRCTSDVETLRLFLSQQVVEVGRAVAMFITPIPLMLSIDPRMTIAAVALLPFVFTFSLVYFLRIKSAFKEKDEAEGALTATIQENLSGIRVVRAFARQDYEINRFDEKNEKHRHLDNRLYRLMARFWSLSDFLCMAQLAAVVFVGVLLVTRGELGVGGFYFFLTATALFTFPLRMMGRILTDLGKAIVALDRIREILEEPIESDSADESDVELLGGVRFTNVSFRHSGSELVLDNVSFQIEPGQTLALLGPSGSGKTTAIELLLRLHEYDSGRIELDGRDVRTIRRESLRSQMAVVMQEPFLYSKPLRENLTIGRPNASEEEMIGAALIAAVHENIESFDRGYDTSVGERGVTLSGGQRQRVALARAILQNPAVLILDDSLSAVDTETESMILRALRERRHAHTTVVIAHRLSTLMHADTIVVLEEGRVVQVGNHASLVSQSGMYKRLWDFQNDHDAMNSHKKDKDTTVEHKLMNTNNPAAHSDPATAESVEGELND